MLIRLIQHIFNICYIAIPHWGGLESTMVSDIAFAELHISAMLLLPQTEEGIHLHGYVSYPTSNAIISARMATYLHFLNVWLIMLEQE